LTYIVNTEIEPPFSMFITTYLQESTSMIMAKFAALALATSLCRNMGLQKVNFYTNNQLLVNCINGANPSNPPDWRIKLLTQTIIASLQDSYNIQKISRTQNHMAHSLANTKFHQNQFHHIAQPSLCTNHSHAHGCPLLCALQIVIISSVMILTVSYC
jgi:ribonuclease HI